MTNGMTIKTGVIYMMPLIPPATLPPTLSWLCVLYSGPLLPPPPPASWLMRMSLPPRVKIELVDKLADIEHRLAYGTNERLQLGALVAMCVLVRPQIVAAAV